MPDAERDPRIDPFVGDVLRFPRIGERRVVDVRFTYDDVIVDMRPASGGRLCHQWLKRWRKRAVKAEVIHKGQR